MIQLTYEQKNSIGLQYILDRLNPSSPYGQERVRRMTPYTSEEKDLLMEELSNLEKLMNKKEDLKQEINHLRRIFMQMKDVRPTIKKAREMCLNDIELFEMKNFLIYSEQARSEANYVNGQTKMTGLGYMDLEAALDILDPDGRRIPSFYIYEAYSEKLDDIRKRKRELEKSMEIAAEETKKEYQNLRHQVVLEEEESVQEQLPPEVEEAMLRSLQEKLLSYCTSNPKIGKELKKQAEGLNKLKSFIQVVGGTLPLGYEKRQELLEADSLTAQYEILMKILLYETNIQQIKNELQEKVKERIDQNQREYILREEMKVIREELGEDNTTSDIRQFEESLEKLEADDTVKERIKKEIVRFKNVANSPSEGSVVRGYIETLLDLPWNKKSVDNTDLKNAEQILNDDHYGLEKVKERVLEFLAVR